MSQQQTKGDLGYSGYSVTLNYFTALPNPNIISDANVAVFFKSLLKNNSITKEKSLNDLLEALNNKDNESSFQDQLTILSWVQLYPKLATDNSRTVRVLSHQVQAKFLQVVGGKNYSKHLKSSLPVWILGLFDSDKTVATATYRSFLDCFQDKERIDKVWVVFYDQILNFIVTVISLETHESLSDKRYTKEVDSMAKYERVLNSCLMMLIKIIGLFNDGTLKISEKESTITDLEAIFTSDNIWDYLGTSIAEDNLNLLLFKNILVLIKTLFAKSEDSEDANTFIMSLTDSKSIFKVIAKKFVKNVKLKASSKSATAGILYSNVISQFWDTLITVTEFTSLPIKSLKIKKNFWQLGGDKSHSRVIDYLRLGSCNSDAHSYYGHVSRFFKSVQKLEDKEFIDFSSTEEAQLVLIKVFCKNLNSLKTLSEKHACISCVLNVYSLFHNESENPLDSILKLIFYTCLNSVSMKSRSTQQFSQETCCVEISSKIEKFVDEKFFEDLTSSIVSVVEKNETVLSVTGFTFDSTPDSAVNNYLRILHDLGFHKLSSDLIANITGKLEEDSSLETPELAFHFISSYLNQYKEITAELESFLETLPSFLSNDFIDPVLSLFADFAAVSKADLSQTIEDFFLELSTICPSRLPKFLLTVQEHIHDAKLQDVSEYIIELSNKSPLSEDESELIYKFAGERHVLENLLQSSTSSEDSSLRFIKEFSRKATDVSELEKNAFLKSLLQVAWKHIKQDFVIEFLSKFKDIKLLNESILQYIHASSHSTNFLEIANFLRGKEELLEVLVAELTSSVHELSANDLAISNPLNQNLCLVSSKNESIKLDSTITIYAKFVSDVLSEVVDKHSLILLAAFISEYVDDYLFLESRTKLQDSEVILQIKGHLQNKFMESVKDVTLDSVLTVLNDEVPNSLTGQLVQKIVAKSSVSAYAARSLKLILDKIFDNLTLQGFEDAQINFNKMTKTPIILAVFLSSGSRFFTKSAKFDRIRNFAAAEILGARKESDILGLGLQWITLVTNFFNSEETYEIIPSHRLAMVINQLSSWLDSDIAYDDEFIVIRVQIARFLTGLLQNQVDVPDKTWELAVKLINDNLSTCQVQKDRRDLRFFTLKLLNIVTKISKSDPIEELDDAKAEINEELLDLFVSKEIVKLDLEIQNQAVLLTHDLISRVYYSIDFSQKLLNDKIDDFYALISIDFVPLQRMAISTLQKVIIANQRDFLLEYQLQKPLEGEQKQLQAKFPETLLRNVNIAYPEDIETSTLHPVSVYLWSWCLVFSHFEDITYSMRSDYLAQFKESNAIEVLLNYIFEQVEVSDVKFLQKLTSAKLGSTVKPEDNLIKSYSAQVGCPGESFEFELKFLLIHLYYLSFRFLGSQIQTWFNEIRDLQLKQKIEKFSIKFVSPLLVSKLMTEVANDKDKVESKDENLKIRVNTVTNEIKSTYVIDEHTMEMVIKVPFNYPLNNVTIDGPLRLGVKENQWKAWLLASQRVISLANGSIMDAIEIFNKNVNLHFSGFEECAICYSILHQDLSLPSKNCPTCSNKFHAACLYKWFKSSGSSTCPLCRSSFTFRNSRSVAV